MLHSSHCSVVAADSQNLQQNTESATCNKHNRQSLALVPHCRDRAGSDYRKLQPPKARCRISICQTCLFSELLKWGLWGAILGREDLKSGGHPTLVAFLHGFHSKPIYPTGGDNDTQDWVTENKLRTVQLFHSSQLFMRNTHRGSTSLCELNQQACNTTVGMTLHGETKIRRMYIIIVFLFNCSFFKEDEMKAFAKLCHRKHCFSCSNNSFMERIKSLSTWTWLEHNSIIVS